MDERTKLHLGCGKRDFGQDWIHADKADFPHIDFKSVYPLDYMETGKMDLVYASHLLPYFDREEAPSVLAEWVRVLRPGGILRLSVTDFREVARLFVLHNSFYDVYPIEKFLGMLFGKMRCNESEIYHKTVYDYVSLKRLMQEAGLTNVGTWDWRNTCHSQFDDHSQAYLPHMDKINGTRMSLNIEGVKP